jgi:hypothetical protein
MPSITAMDKTEILLIRFMVRSSFKIRNPYDAGAFVNPSAGNPLLYWTPAAGGCLRQRLKRQTQFGR